jgi:hypothetical protein
MADVNDQFNSAGIVVAAEVVSESTIPVWLHRLGHDFSVHEQSVKWRVAYSWKGGLHADESLQTKTTYWNGGCGVQVSMGSAMLLFFPGDSQGQPIALCGGSRSLVASLHLIPDIFQLPGVDPSPPNYSLERTEQSPRD